MFYCRAGMGGFVVVLRIVTDSFAIIVSTVKNVGMLIHTKCVHPHHHPYTTTRAGSQAPKRSWTTQHLNSWWTVHSSSNLHEDCEGGQEWFTVCALCYSTNNPLCTLCAMAKSLWKDWGTSELLRSNHQLQEYTILV